MKKMEEKMFCKKCGEEISEEWTVCPQCGEMLRESLNDELQIDNGINKTQYKVKIAKK